MSRLVMLPPMRPSPTIPILMLNLRSFANLRWNRALSGPFHRRFASIQLVDGDPEHAAAVCFQALVVADGLGGDERAEVVRIAGDRHGGTRFPGDQLHRHDAVRAALVELAGPVQGPGPVASGRRHS